ncbi:hypothetical protein [Streptomyces sp. JH002]
MNCDLLVGLDDLHVMDIDPGDGDRLTVRVESARPASRKGRGRLS